MTASLPPDWVGAYVGLPYRVGGRDRGGLDCWGLVRLVLAERFGVAAPVYDGVEYDPATVRQLADTFQRERDATWSEVPPDAARPGDVVLLRLRGVPIHVGIVIADGLMLHVEEGKDACWDEWRGARWRNRVIGVYRHAG